MVSIILPPKNITNLTFETIAHNINALAGDVLGDVLVISGDVLVMFWFLNTNCTN